MASATEEYQRVLVLEDGYLWLGIDPNQTLSNPPRTTHLQHHGWIIINLQETALNNIRQYIRNTQNYSVSCQMTPFVFLLSSQTQWRRHSPRFDFQLKNIIWFQSRLLFMALQAHITDRHHPHFNPQPHRRLPTCSNDNNDLNYNSPLNKPNTKAYSPRTKANIPERQHTHPLILKLMIMKEMVMGLMVHHPTTNKDISDRLNELLCNLKILISCVPQKASKTRERLTSNIKSESDVWIKESKRLAATLGKLREASNSKEIRQTLVALQKMREKIIDEINGETQPKELKRLESFKSKSPIKTSRESDKLELELKDLKTEMAVLRKEKVKMMVELNREMEISNKKSEDIKILQTQLGRKENNPQNVQRCRSSSKEDRSLFSQLDQKKQKIESLSLENESLKKQLAKLKEVDFSESFLSDAFNFRDEQMHQTREEYQRTISELKARISQLVNDASSNRLSDFEGDKVRSSNEHTTEGKSTIRSDKDRSNQMSNKLLSRVSDLEACLKREETQRRSLEKEVQFLRVSQKSLVNQITFLKGQLCRNKSPSMGCPSEMMRSSSNSQIHAAGFRYRR